MFEYNFCSNLILLQINAPTESMSRVLFLLPPNALDAPPLKPDCGAGVGRVTNELLIHLFDEVDLLEPSMPLLQSAQKNLGHGSKKPKGQEVPSGHRAVHFYHAGLEQHVFEPERYDCIW